MRTSFYAASWERKDTILLNMTEAMKALSPPSQEAPPDEGESPETADEQQGRGVRPTPLRERLRRAYRGLGGVGWSVAKKIGGDHGLLERRTTAPACQRAGAEEDRRGLTRAEG